MEKNITNISQCTEKVLETIGRTWDDVIATTFIYVPSSDNDGSTRGINLQLFGHVLIIVPDMNDPTSYYMYTTKNTIDRNHIINDLISRGYSQIQVAKMMKCSPGTVNHVMSITSAPVETTTTSSEVE